MPLPNPLKSGVYPGITNAEYHGGPGVSKSQLDDIARCPAIYSYRREHPEPDTASTIIGTAAHCLILEPEVFEPLFVCEPKDAPRKPNKTQREAKKPSAATVDAIAFWDAFYAENSDKEIITEEQWNLIHAMRDSVYEKPNLRRLLEHGQREISGYGVDPDTGLLRRCRPDFLNENGVIVDLKTTDDASPSAFRRKIANYRYYVQDPYYRDTMTLATGEAPAGFMFLVVEKEPPHLCAGYNLVPEAIAVGREEYRNDLRTLARCLERDEWPGYSDKVEPIDIPRWKYAEADLMGIAA